MRNLYPIFATSAISEPTLKMQRTCASTVTPDNTREILQVNARIAPQASTLNNLNLGMSVLTVKLDSIRTRNGSSVRIATRAFIRGRVGRNVTRVTPARFQLGARSHAPLAPLVLIQWTRPVIALIARQACITQKVTREIVWNATLGATRPSPPQAAPSVPRAPIVDRAIQGLGKITSTARTRIRPHTRIPTLRP